MNNFLYRKFIKYKQKTVDNCTKLRYILNRKAVNFSKIAMRLKEKEIIQQFINSPELYDPLTIIRYEEQPPFTQDVCPDAVIEFSIPGGPSFQAMVKIQSVPTPRQIFLMFGLLRNFVSETKNTVPMVIAPYIGKRQTKTLADEGVSWIDLSGNMVIKVSGKIYIERTGKPNKFPDTAPIKKIFQGTSSLVSRALLLRREGFSSQYELVDFINNRNANITPGTVSRVLKSLEEELLITKSKSLISVIDAAKLLERLTEGYINYAKRKETKAYRFSIKDLKWVSMRLNLSPHFNYLACGFYAAKIKGLAATDEITISVKDIKQARKQFDFITPDAEFGNLKFIETNDSCSWFNSTEVELTIASIVKVSMAMVDDVELYLEMMVDTPRGAKVAELLKSRILKEQTDG